jgi:outer membrane protein OmpA-like peptidoglycan-associated protein
MMMMKMKQVALAVALFGVVIAGCKTASRSQKCAAIGAAGGGVVGAVIGKAAGNTAMGAIIGATVGGVTGAVIGRKMDKQAEEMQKVLKDDAEVRREGEGIVINFKEKVLFAFNSADLGGNAQANLGKLVDVLNRYPNTNIQVIGHTDSIGTAAYNQTLSERRANSVVSYLQSHNIASSRLSAKGMGQTDPIASNSTEEGRAQNRRVEFVITANEQMKAEAKKEAGQ